MKSKEEVKIMNYVQFNYEKKYIKDFINLPRKIYKENNTENANETKEILKEKHPLNKYFKIYKFLVYNEKKAVGRFAITIYPNDNTAYIGFFECINDKEVAKYLFNVAHDFAKGKNCKKLVGPVDVSFWLKYRLKVNMFDKKPYTGEPYNKDYYLDMFLENNYKIIEHYTSNIYKNLDYNYENEKYSDRYENFITNGYKIESPNMDEFEQILKELHGLLTKLYSDFPIYKNISEKDFVDVFMNYKKVMNSEMIKLAYYNNKMVGFYISVPNYNNLVHNVSLINLIKILRLKKKPKEYVMLYMGVAQEHRGLGKAIVYSIMKELMESKLPSIGALARDGKITQNYAEELIKDRYEYVLLEEKLND